jgi:redox-sensitive bicupin YhaK (pirin superfamily)
MTMARHPHTGLQTITWLFEGAIDHRDSIGSVQQIRPGQLNLMTAGTGVAHSEQSIELGAQRLHAVQLWLAMPEAQRNGPADFQHLADVPELALGDAKVKVFIGEYEAAKSPARVHLPTLGAQVSLHGERVLKLREDWEYGLLLVAGKLRVNGEELPLRHLEFLPVGSSELDLEGEDAVAILIGGQPFEEQIVMWWNFVGRSHEEIVQMREAWNSGIYPEFTDDLGGWIPAPEMPNVRLRAR